MNFKFDISESVIFYIECGFKLEFTKYNVGGAISDSLIFYIIEDSGSWKISESRDKYSYRTFWAIVGSFLVVFSTSNETLNSALALPYSEHSTFFFSKYKKSTFSLRPSTSNDQPSKNQIKHIKKSTISM